mgnify:FL=1|tara:strand:- start:288 stop:1208 length:921 start_codon:yes stop_codon:yes gene_type:complete
MEVSSAKTLRGSLLVFVKGMAMGVADSVPGVSGGTIAVMAGIYEELIHSLKNLNPVSLWEYRKLGLAGFWRSINGNFLLILLLGIVSALYLSANTVLYLLETHYPQLMAFFCGLVLASTFFLRRQVLRWGGLEFAFLVLGVAITLLIAFINPLAGQSTYLYLFLCGAIAISAMILPGISGAFILLLLGVYDYVLAALRALDVGVIVVFAAGCATGLLSFSHLLSWTFRHYREQTYAFLTGMLLASIVVLWPWKLAPEHGAIGASYLSPSAYTAATGTSVTVLTALGFFILGFALVTIFERISRRRS